MTVLLIISLIAAIVILIIVTVVGFCNKKHAAFIKDVLVPVSTPLMVAIIGIVFTLQSEQQQRADQQTAVMRDVIVSQESRDIAFLGAVDTQLENHFERYTNTEDKGRVFDEEAIFFYYGLHRAELSNMSAARGELMFSRLWIEAVYFGMAEDVVVQILGTDDRDPDISPKGEAAMYKYFGRTSVDDAQGRVTTPLLMNFHAFLAGRNNGSLTSEESDALKNEFHIFQDHLHKNEINRQMLQADILGMNALWVYCFNNIFKDWYGLDRCEIPKTPPLPKDAPKQFMAAYMYDVTDGTNAWNRIREIANSQSEQKP